MELLDHIRKHRVPSTVKLKERPEDGMGRHTEEIMDGMKRIEAVTSLVESAIIWRAQYIAWNVDLHKAEQLLFRLIFKEKSKNPQAMDLLARIYFQQGKYEKSKDLFLQARELQSGNPALRRVASQIQKMAKSPSSALIGYRVGLLMRSALMVLLICFIGWGGTKVYDFSQRWLEGPVAVQNLVGRFHYEYDSITKDMVYVPASAVADEDGTYNMGFTRRKASNGREIGRIEVSVERSGSSLKASGRVPTLYVRYLVEESLRGIPGITDVDMGDLTVDRSYRVVKGDSLWISAKKIYGEGSSWTVLARINDLDNPSKLRVGQELSLPLGDETLTQE